MAGDDADAASAAASKAERSATAARTSAADANAAAADADTAATDAGAAAEAANDAAENAPADGSLFDPVGRTNGDNHYGELGPPISRSSAVYRGFFGAIGVLLAVLLALAVREIASVIELIVVSIFLAVGLNPIVELLIRRGAKRNWAVLAVTVVFLGLLSVVVFELVGVLRDQISSFIDHAPHLLDTLRRHKSIRNLDDKYHIITNLEKKLKNPDLAEETFRGIFNTGLGLLRAAASTLVVFVLTTYFLAALPQLKRAMYSLAPASRRARVVALGDEILRRVGRYVIGAFLVALLAGTVTAIFLVCVGLGQYALPLALFVALLDLVPLVGSITGASVVCIVCLATSLDVGIAAIIFYLVYEPLEGYVIYPRVMRSSIDVPEYVTVLAVLFGGAVDGVVGALLALPIAAALILLIREVWVRRQDVR